MNMLEHLNELLKVISSILVRRTWISFCAGVADRQNIVVLSLTGRVGGDPGNEVGYFQKNR